jgi:NADPH:quinone reductase-like Zn-dependent oxidoreductase
MRALIAPHPGGPEVLTMVDLPVPEPGRGEVRVAVKACGVNPLDYKVREGYRAEGRLWPAILGWDVAGVVDAVGHDVESFSPGDPVFYCADFARPGAYADYHIADATLLAPLPTGLTFPQAASLPLAVGTVAQGLGRQARLAPSETIAIFGAAGGVGGFAVAYAKHLGATVIAVASSGNAAYIDRLGADHIVAYDTIDPATAIADLTDGRGVDVVFDTVGESAFAQGIASLAPFGRLVFLNAFAGGDGPLSSLNPARFVNASLICELLIPAGETMRAVARLVASGAITPQAIETIPLDDVPDAHRLLATRRGHGKRVIDLRL